MLYNKILVPLDGSKVAECSLEEVKNIASGCRVPEVVLMTVVEPVSDDDYWSGMALAGYNYSPGDLEKIKQDIERVHRDSLAAAGDYLHRMADELSEDGIDVKTEVMEGGAAPVILDYAEQNGVDLIIVSTHGFRDNPRWDLGHLADKIIRASSAPVVVVAPAECRL